MAVQRNRMSKSAQGQGHSHDHLHPKNHGVCPNCGAHKQGHRACLSCGLYKGRVVLKAKDQA